MVPEKRARQLELELESVALGKASYENKVATAYRQKNASSLISGQLLLADTIEAVAHSIQVARMTRKKTELAPAASIPNTELAYIALQALLDLMPQRPQLTRAAITIGKMVMEHVEYTRFSGLLPAYLRTLEESLKTYHAGLRKSIILKSKRAGGIADIPVTTADLCKIGMRLLSIIIDTTGLVAVVKVHSQNKIKTFLRLSEDAEEFIARVNSNAALLCPVYQPMVCPPKPWTSINDGGFLGGSPHKLIQSRNKAILEAHHNMPQVYDAVNALQNTRWRINKDVWQVMERIWRDHDGLGVLPPREGKPLPPKPWDQAEFAVLKAAGDPRIVGWKRAAAEVHRENAGSAAKRFGIEFKLAVAKKFSSELAIHFVYFLDWRGRMYPRQQYLSPQGDDSGRALLEFADAVPLGEEGANWLAIHGANVYGEVDKAPFATRIEWVHSHEADIIDAANDPIGCEFWRRADSPWKFLAFCFEWAKYLKTGPSHMSRIPVGVDGSCNGLQHYAAMLRDEEGGKYTNLVPSDRPQDIYSAVAEHVTSLVEEDLSNDATFGNSPYTYSALASWWAGKVDRKLCKRPVMTTPYSVSKRGIIDQIYDELAHRNLTAQYSDIDLKVAAKYLAAKVSQAIAATIRAACDAEHWLKEATKIFLAAKKAVCWVTPTGFSVRQEAYTQKTMMINTIVGKKRLRLSLNEDTKTLSRFRQLNGIAPNFIHSMDASHLVMTINECVKQGLTNFHVVHDSYAVHAACVPTLNKVLREAFIALYSTNQLERVRQQFLTQLPGVDLPAPPSFGALNLEAIRDSRYFFA